MKPLNKFMIAICMLLAPLFSMGQQSNLELRVQRLERVVERQNQTLRMFEDRLTRLEYGNNNPYPGPVYPNPNPVEPRDICTVSYNSSSCSGNIYGYKYSIESNGKAVSECMSSLSSTINSFNNLKQAGVCRTADMYNNFCKLSYNSDACSGNIYGYKYAVEINGKTATECYSSQSSALNAIKTLKDANLCK